MAFESEEKKSDFDAWAESLTYEEEKELKKQEKKKLKEQRKAEKEARKKGYNSEDLEEVVDSVEGAHAPAEKADSESGYKPADRPSDEAAKDDDSAEASENGDAQDGDSEEKPKKKKKQKKEKANPDYIKEKEKKPAEEVNIVKELLSLIIYIGVVIILCYCIITYVGQRTTVNGRSMENTLHDGDNLWIDKLSYHFTDPKRFDVIVFPYEDEVYYIKRIIGLPGESVQIMNDGTILINGKKLIESYGKEIILESGTAAEERVLGEDEYFVLGDNRNDSRDSRWADVGDINREDIIGKAAFRLSPLSKFGKID